MPVTWSMLQACRGWQGRTAVVFVKGKMGCCREGTHFCASVSLHRGVLSLMSPWVGFPRPPLGKPQPVFGATQMLRAPEATPKIKDGETLSEVCVLLQSQ